MYGMLSPKYALLISRIGILLIPILVYLIPLEWFIHQPSVCLSKLVFHRECFGCGISRAVLSGLHLKFAAAMQFNKMVVIVLPLLIYVWLKQIVYFFYQTKGNNWIF